MSRKYRQRGYQDGDAPRRDPAPPRPQREGPRGRGLGAPTSTVFRCARCGAARDQSRPIEIEAVCEDCGADLHTCTHCRHFDGDAPNECRVEGIARIAKKSTANRCEDFEPKVAVESEGGESPGTDARSEFDSLFNF